MVTGWWVCDMVGLLQRGDYTLPYNPLQSTELNYTQLNSTELH